VTDTTCARRDEVNFAGLRFHTWRCVKLLSSIY